MADTAQLRILADGAELECRWAGEPRTGRPAIVLLHEGLGSLAMWKDFPDQLAARTGCPVFAYSRRGYGGSDPLVGARDVDYLHHEALVVLPQVLAAAGIERPVLFGHSDGASIALIYAGENPGVGGLILEAPHLFVEPLTLQGLAEAKAAYRTTALGQRLGRYHPDPDRVFRAWNDIWLDPRFRAWNIEAYVPQIACPVLLVQGRDDEYGTDAQLDAVANRLAAAEVLLLDACGHIPHRDQSEVVLNAAQRFVATRLRAGELR